jgi:hypothetical protein
MSAFIATLQIFLLLPALPLVMLSYRTPRRRNTMQYRRLGRAGLRVSTLSLGPGSPTTTRSTSRRRSR